jgi:hypothetical protein
MRLVEIERRRGYELRRVAGLEEIMDVGRDSYSVDMSTGRLYAITPESLLYCETGREECSREWKIPGSEEGMPGGGLRALEGIEKSTDV